MVSETSDSPPLPVPEGTRLFHIGPMKTGTTSLQRALSGQRAELLENGVRYPGNEFNHRRAVGAFMGTRVAKRHRPGVVGQAPAKRANDPSIPPEREWDELLDEAAADDWRRVVISHELAAHASEERARKFVESLGDQVHIVITLRDLAAVLPSFWAQMLKSARTDSLDAWLQRVFGDDPDSALSTVDHRSLDHGGLIERWVSIVGPENMTVIVADDDQPNRLTDAFERLLNLPSGFLTNYPTDRFSSNRSLRRTETELLLQLNRVCNANQVSWEHYTSLISRGMIRRLRKGRAPGPDEPRVQLPSWAAERCQERGKSDAQRIEASGVRVIGDLSSLYSAGPSTQITEQSPSHIPVDVAVEALAGLMSASLRRGAFFSNKRRRKQMKAATIEPQSRARPSTEDIADSHSTRELAAALKIRVMHHVRKDNLKQLAGTALKRK